MIVGFLLIAAKIRFFQNIYSALFYEEIINFVGYMTI